MDFIFKIDMQILIWIQNNLKNTYLDSFFKILTFLTDRGFIWIIIGLILFISKKTRIVGIELLFSLFIGSILVNDILKPIFQRTRPCDIMMIDLIIKHPGGYSFPSGHTASAFSAAFSAFLNNKKLGFILIIIAVISGFSRMYLFVHYPSDVLAGMIIGLISAFLAFMPFKIFKGGRNLW